jgi:hypothetical protein
MVARLAAVDRPICYVVEERHNPSSDYFVLPELGRMGFKPIRCEFADVPAAGSLLNAAVAFVRYLPKGWRHLVQPQRHRLRGLYFFMDDDLFDLRASAGMPWRYRYKLARLAGVHQGWLRRQKAEIWVSTPYLQQKYRHWNPRLVLPQPLQASHESVRIFYHGTASHQAEIDWLYPVMQTLLQSDERLSFELMGGEGVYRRYRRLPGVSVVHPMSWRAYQAFSSLSGRHIGLVPQLDQAFNHARSYTKFFDITRAGAVGVYSQYSACADVLTHGRQGLLCAMQEDAWVAAIRQLVNDAPLRSGLLAAAEQRCQDLQVL